MPSPSSRPIRILLVTSLAVNLLLGAALTTALVLHHRSTTYGIRLLDTPSPRVLARHLNEKEQKQLHAILHGHRPRFQMAGSEMMDARRRVRHALTNEPFEPDVLAVALADLHHGQGRLSAEAQAVIIELARGMDSEGRRRLARAMARPWRDEQRRRQQSAPPPS